MSTAPIKQWVEVAELHPDVVGANFSEDIFALDLGPLADAIAWSLGKKKGYELYREQDEMRVAPGGDDILQLLADSPNLILLDEVLNYLISAGGIKVEQTTLRDETLTFIQRLTVAVAN